ncbi:MAG: HAMP domain-containing histidine kinase [Lachnospiraceae bacterium]|nr:HAMP domain-containing histidine kinase [Lachnospiraceae bacterium]
MKSIPKLIRRFTGIMLLSSILIIILDIVLLYIYTSRQKPNSSPWKTAEETASGLKYDGREYVLSGNIASELENSGIWAIFIDNNSMQVVWHTDNLPGTVPMSYSVSDIAHLVRGYIDGYPAFTGEAEDGLVVLGYPKKSFWKHMWPSWDYSLIANLPKTILSFLLINILLVFIIYVTANSNLLKSVKPIIKGIQSLPLKKHVYVKEKGLFSEIAISINKTSEILQSQDRKLQKRENARVNWIAGVSHDIRTPLSMVMGYASQLEEDKNLSDSAHQMAAIIVKQSGRIKSLINDLNLASKLEYSLNPLNLEKENMVAIARQVVVSFINMDIESRYPVEWQTDGNLTSCFVYADKNLLKRAISNLIQNCISHNPSGCKIYTKMISSDGFCTIIIADDGIGASKEQIEKINHSPHYMACDENTAEQCHGLGLLIVKQVAAAHNGKFCAGSSPYGGFSASLSIPLH